MGQPPDQPSREKGLSAHQAGLLAPRGKTVYDPDAASAERPGGLTAREEEIVLLLAEDLTNAQISEKTRTGIATVKSHIHNILGKINGRTRASAIIWVLRRRLEMKDREILILKELLAKQGLSGPPSSPPGRPSSPKTTNPNLT